MSWRDVIKPIASGTPSYSISPQYSEMPAEGEAERYSEDTGDSEYRCSPSRIPEAEAEARDRGRARLEALARELSHPLEDLVDWYRDDLVDFGDLPAEQVEWIARAYVQHRDIYRPPPPPPPALGAGTATCETCQHSTQTDHPHLVRCEAVMAPGNPTGRFWASDPRHCHHHEPLEHQP